MPSTRERVPFEQVSRAGRRRWALTLISFMVLQAEAPAQFLRIGPLDFDATLGLTGYYTSNVDGVRKSQATKEMQDYYGVASLDIASTSDLVRNSKLAIDVGMTVEKHVNRPDLDTVTEPFGRARVDGQFDFGRYTLLANASHDTESTTATDTYVPGNRRTRDVNSTDGAGVGLNWKYETVSAGVRYAYAQERHQDKDFQDGDQDTQNFDLNARWDATRRVSLLADYERDKTDLINQPDSFKDWNETTSIGLSFLLLDRPHSTYELSLEQTTSQGQTQSWQPVHTFNVGDELQLARNLRLSGGATYTIKQHTSANELDFTYNLAISHDISDTAHESLTFQREPARTFGSTIETDSTRYGYDFTKSDLFIYNLTLDLGVQCSIDEPMSGSGQSGETTWTYTAGLTYPRKVSRKIDRVIAYHYSYETSSLQSEPLEEHRVSISYVYKY